MGMISTEFGSVSPTSASHPSSPWANTGWAKSREREGERERNIHVWLPPGGLAHSPGMGITLTGNRTSNPLVCRPALNPLSHISQGHCSKFHAQFLCVSVYPSPLSPTNNLSSLRPFFMGSFASHLNSFLNFFFLKEDTFPLQST